MDQQGATSTTNSKIMPINRSAGVALSFLSHYPTTVTPYNMMNARDEHHRPPSPPIAETFLMPSTKPTILPHANNAEHSSQLSRDHNHEFSKPPYNQHHTTQRPSVPNSWHNDRELLNDADHAVSVEDSLMNKHLDAKSATTPPNATHQETVNATSSAASAHSQISSSLSSFVKPLVLPRHTELKNPTTSTLPVAVGSEDFPSDHQHHQPKPSTLNNGTAGKVKNSFNVVNQPLQPSAGTSSSAKLKKPLPQKHLDFPAEVIVDLPSEIAVKLQNFLLFPNYNPDKDDVPINSSDSKLHAVVAPPIMKAASPKTAVENVDRSLRPSSSNNDNATSNTAPDSSGNNKIVNKPWSRHYHYPLSVLSETRAEPTGSESIGYQLHRLGVLAVQFENGVAFNLPAYHSNSSTAAGDGASHAGRSKTSSGDANVADIGGSSVDANHTGASSSSNAANADSQDADGKPKKRGRGRRRKDELEIGNNSATNTAAGSSSAKTAYYKKRAVAAAAAAAAKAKAKTKLVIGNSWVQSLNTVPPSVGPSADAVKTVDSSSSGTFVNPNKVKSLDQTTNGGGGGTTSALQSNTLALTGVRGATGGTVGAASGANKRQRTTPAKPRGPRTTTITIAAGSSFDAVTSVSVPKSKAATKAAAANVLSSTSTVNAATPTKPRAPKRQKTTSTTAVSATNAPTVNSNILFSAASSTIISTDANVTVLSSKAMSHAISSSSTTTTPTSISSGNGGAHSSVAVPKARAPKRPKAASVTTATAGPIGTSKQPAASTKAAAAKKAPGGPLVSAGAGKPKPQQQRQSKQQRTDTVAVAIPVMRATPTIVAPPSSAAIMLQNNVHYNNMQSSSQTAGGTYGGNPALSNAATQFGGNVPPITGNGITPVIPASVVNMQQQQQHFGIDMNAADQQHQYHFHPPVSASTTLQQLPMAAPLLQPAGSAHQQRLLSSAIPAPAPAAAAAASTARSDSNKMSGGINVVLNSPLLVNLLKSGTSTSSTIDAPTPSTAAYASAQLGSSFVVNSAGNFNNNNNVPVLTALSTAAAAAASAAPARVVPSSPSSSSSSAAAAASGVMNMNAVGANNGGNVISSLDRRLLEQQQQQQQPRYS